MQGIRFKQDLISSTANVGNEMSTHIGDMVNNTVGL